MRYKGGPSHRRSIARKIKTTKKIIDLTIDEFEKSGISVKTEVRKNLIQAMITGTRTGKIVTDTDVIKCTSALIMSGSKETTNLGIRYEHFGRGWRKLQVCPGNVPPPYCMNRSIIQRDDDLNALIPGYKPLVVSVETRLGMEKKRSGNVRLKRKK